MGNSATKELDVVPAKPYFLIERILTPEIRVGVVGGSEQTQGIRVADGKIRRLKTFESNADELLYVFEKGAGLRLSKCPTEAAPKRVCYTLTLGEFMPYPVKVDCPLDERIRETFKPISMGDATKEIDAMGDLFAGKN